MAAATVEIHRFHGNPGDGHAITAKNYFTTSDEIYESSPDYPLPVPSADSYYSYWMVLRPYVSSMGTMTTLSNFRFYMNAAWGGGAGITFLAQTATGYVQASGTEGETGLELTTGNYATLTTDPVDPFTWVVGSPKSLSGTIVAVGYGTVDYIVIQALVAAGGEGKAQSDFGFTFAWDEA